MASDPSVSLSLDAVIMAVTDGAPRVLVVDAAEPANEPAFPSGALDLDHDATLELALRRCIREQTGLEVGYAEQLYTFGDRHRRRDDYGSRSISIAYLALVQESPPTPGASWRNVYDLFPWEDHRQGMPSALGAEIEPALAEWTKGDEERANRVQLAFGSPWDGIRVLDRYELLYEAALVSEHSADSGAVPTNAQVGDGMSLDHRRIGASALGRLRGKLTYRPVVFELLPKRFTLLELQRTVEALAGVPLHKQNFRRLVERSGLVEGTGDRAASHGGRPAELFRYRPEVQLERPRPGVGQPYR